MVRQLDSSQPISTACTPTTCPPLARYTQGDRQAGKPIMHIGARDLQVSFLAAPTQRLDTSMRHTRR
jgi:hypothetical protein